MAGCGGLHRPRPDGPDSFRYPIVLSGRYVVEGYGGGTGHQRLGSEQAYRKRVANAQRKVERKIIRQSFRQDSLCRKKVLRQVFRRICNPSLKKGSTSLFCGFAIRLYNNPKMKKGKENET